MTADEDSERGAAEQRLLDALDGLLADGETFTALDVRRITSRAGLARTSFYNHFPDKTTALLALLGPATSEIFGAAAGWARDPHHDLAGLRTTTLEVIGAYRANAHLLRALGEATTYDPVASRFWRSRMEDLVDVFRRRIEEAGGDSPLTAAIWLAWGTERAISEHVALGGDGIADEEFADGVARSVWGAMTTR